MYSIRYLFKNAGSQISFWDDDVSHSETAAMKQADNLPVASSNEIIEDTGWFREEENFWRRKVVFAITSPEENNFSLHITVGLSSESHKSGI